MDTLSHALYGKGIFGYRKYRWFSFLFGAIPDLLSFGVYFVFQILSSGLDLEKLFSEKIPLWVYSLYDISHSLVIAFIFIGIAYNVNKDFAWPMLGWPLHIVIDLFTHSIEFFPTPIFWPISNYRFDGIPWSNPYVLMFNFVLIILIFIIRRKKHSLDT
jgi:hypothetical protein